MPCTLTPPSPAPSLPSPLTLGAAPPGFSFDLSLCCKLLPFPITPGPVPFVTGTLNPALVAVINAQLALMKTYHDSFTFDCPLE